MRLHSLIRQIEPATPLAGVPNVEVTGVREDSRQVRPGDLFVARAGTKADGSQYLLDAHARGAVAAVVTVKVADAPLPQIVVKDPAAAASSLANAFRGHPSADVRVLGITGTNGK